MFVLEKARSFREKTDLFGKERPINQDKVNDSSKKQEKSTRRRDGKS